MKNNREFSDRMQAQSAGNVLTHLTSRDGVPRVRSGEPEKRGDRIQRGESSHWVRSMTKTLTLHLSVVGD
jgi:hypothetical protein